MNAIFKSLVQVLDFFKEDEVWTKYLIDQRWNGKPKTEKTSSTVSSTKNPFHSITYLPRS